MKGLSVEDMLRQERGLLRPESSSKSLMPLTAQAADPEKNPRVLKRILYLHHVRVPIEADHVHLLSVLQGCVAGTSRLVRPPPES